jgi:tetraacyldisaccharide 4'-kinase
LREPVFAAAKRCQAAVLIGEDETGALAQLPADLPVLRARLVPGPEAAALAGKPVVAFCGIANPRKFFTTLQEAGAVLAARHPFADHYPFDDQEIRDLLAEAEKLRATPVTTRKDIVRIPPGLRAGIQVVSIALAWDDPAAIEALLDKALASEA